MARPKFLRYQRAGNYAFFSAFAAAFLVRAERDLPNEPKVLLPLLVRLSPLPIVVNIFIMRFVIRKSS